MKKIILVEDDAGISTSLKLYLENSDFEVDVFDTWVWAAKYILESTADLAILDINLPGEDGIQICEKIRKESSLPIIMLTARGSESDRISWLEIWADDYISKPFSPRELLARINTIMRRTSESLEEKNDSSIKIWNIRVDTLKNEILLQDKVVPVTKNEYDIFLKIAQEQWGLVSRETLMKEVIWYDNYVYDRTIDTHIKNLRKKIWDKDLIITIRWKWYRLNI